jgi:hypothetical protein
MVGKFNSKSLGYILNLCTYHVTSLSLKIDKYIL